MGRDTNKDTEKKGIDKRQEVLSQAIQQITKVYGKGSIMRLDEQELQNIECISTGSLSLDIALGGRGIPRGRIAEFFGPESSGKTTLALSVVAQAQKDDGVAAFVDAEHALDPSWAKRVGVNLESLLVSQPDTGEQALDIVEMLVRTNAVDVIVVDSVAALIPEAELRGEMGDSQMAAQARLMSKALRKLAGIIQKTKTCVIFINQLRHKIGITYGNPETTPGGMALKFYSSVRIDLRKSVTIKDADRIIGNRIKAKVVKNKVAPPFRTAEFDIMFDKGISIEGDILDLGCECKVIKKSGAWFNYGQISLGQGREKAKQYLAEHPDLMEKIKQEILEYKDAIGQIQLASSGADELAE